ncbi:MAG: recombinase family protein [Clostridia bacterium]|nr:recombinase family protein [Clostridia bacterium]
MDRVCIYLRKSRADEEAEKLGTGETLAKHKKTLFEVAKKLDLNIIKIHEEIVSGESLIHRPEMLELLKEVEQGLYDGVLVMDMDRLGRGNMQEQGLILETFKKASTKIITPRKIYDLQDEFDEEYSEFEAFMARKELKIINRRLQRGRVRSVEDGNYIGTLPPYGYEIYYIDRYRTLSPHPEQAPIVRMIFDLYTNHGMGANKIANKLNELGYKTYTGKRWSSSSVLTILKNEVYTGKVQWRKKEYRKSDKPGQIKEVRTLPRNEWISVQGKHKPLIPQETYNKAQEILNKRSHVPYNTKISNPLAGLIRCGKCGASMVFRTYTRNRDPHIICYNRTHCSNKSSKFKYVERRLLKGLEEWLTSYKAEWDEVNTKRNFPSNNLLKVYEAALNKLNNKLKQLEKQKNNLHDLLERGVYDIDTYLERSQILAKRIDDTNHNIKNADQDLISARERLNAKKNIIPQVEKVLELYPKTQSPAKKNKLLKSVLDYAVYEKEKNQRNDEFTLVLYPKLPK